MEAKGIDWNAGVTSKLHGKTGIWINMYKNEPGIFYDMRGGLVSDTLARECGFDVAKLKREADRKGKVSDAMQSIEAEFSDADEREVLFAKGDYKVIAAAKGFADIFDVEGNMMNNVKMKRSEALRVAEELTRNIHDEEPEPEAA